MFVEKINLTDDHEVTLTGYISELSWEMPNMDVRPAMLVIPGGGYHMCSRREAEPVAFEYLAKGFNVFILRYSLKEKAVFPRPLNDAIAALKLIRDNAEKWHTDPNKVAAIGFSAGGHLCAALSTMSEEKPNACILGYPCIIEETCKILAAPEPALDDKVTPDTPPTFIFAASDDKVVPLANSYKYALALEKNEVPYELHVFQKGGHGFSTATNVVLADPNNQEKFRPDSYWVQRSIDWLYDIFKEA